MHMQMEVLLVTDRRRDGWFLADRGSSTEIVPGY